MANVIIHESVLDNVSVHHYEKTPLGTIRFVMIMQEADRPNRNKRIYPKAVLEEALQAPYVKERLMGKSLMQEMGHPLDTSVQRQTTIVQTNAASFVEKFWWEGNILYGLCETLNTTLGRDLAGMIEQGVKIATSLRAQGNVSRDMNGYSVVQPGMQIITYDIVVNPSHDKAFIQSVTPETRTALFGSEKVTEAAIREACMLCESGNLFEIDEESNQIITEDYVPGYNNKVRTRGEMYFLQEGDKLTSAKGFFGEVTNGNHVKKVVLEDFFRQDLRKAILAEAVEEKTYDSKCTKLHCNGSDTLDCNGELTDSCECDCDCQKEEKLEENFKQAIRDGGEKATNYIQGQAYARMQRPTREVYMHKTNSNIPLNDKEQAFVEYTEEHAARDYENRAAKRVAKQQEEHTQQQEEKHSGTRVATTPSETKETK